MKNKSFKRVLLGITFLYLTLCIGAYSLQKKMIFPAYKKYISLGIEANKFKEVKHITKDNIKLTSWYVPPKNKKNKVVLYLHGNGGNISHRITEYAPFIEEGYGLFALDYRGYGKSGGSPSEEGLYKDAESAVDYLKNKGFQNKDIILYGESLGTAVAIQLASEMDFDSLILESPFTSMLAVGKIHYPYLPVSLLLTEKFDSLSKLSNINENILIMHGTNDGIVPYSEGLEVYNKLKEYNQTRKDKRVIQMVTFKNKGHNNHDLEETYNAWKSFLQDVTKNNIISRQ